MRLSFFIVTLISLVFAETKTRDEHPLKMYLPDDLKIELWAESPMLYNPTNMDTDIKGRIWVTEGVNYRNFNNDSTTFYHQPAGDRIVILSDTNGDGKADTQKVFVQDKDLVAPLGIAVLGKEILVSCAPYLIKYTDEDGDDKPDKKEIILKGFGGHDHDHSLHSLVAGPDGKLYFSVGNAGPHLVTDKAGFTLRSGSIYTGGSPYNTVNKGNQVSDDGKVWVGGLQLRINPDGTGLEILAHNFRNSYETYVDGNGDMWQNDNDDQVVTCRVSWLAEGGNAGFFSADGTRTWSADQRPGQDMFTAHWHQQDPGTMPAGDNSGAGSPTGMLRNESEALGSKYLGMLWSADAGRNVIFGYMPERKSSGYDLSGKRSIFLSSNAADNPAYEWNDKRFLEDNSKWFRPSDIVMGTDGALYVADWYDAVVGGHRIKDEEAYGRIYRISPKNKELKTPNLSLGNLKSQIETFKNPAINVRNQAFTILSTGGEKNIYLVKKLIVDENTFTKSRAIWLMATLGEKGKKQVFEILKKGKEEERIVAFRALRNVLPPNELLSLISTLTEDNSAFVRREAITALEKFPYSDKNSLLKNYAGEIPQNDTYYLNALSLALGKEKDRFFNENKEWLVNDSSFFELLYTLHPQNAAAYFRTIAEKEEVNWYKKEKSITALAFMNHKQALEYMLKLAGSPDKNTAQMANYWLAFRSSNDWADLKDWSSEKDNLQGQQNLTRMLQYKEKVANEYIAFWDRERALKALAADATGGQILLEMLNKKQVPEDLMASAKNELSKSKDAGIKYQSAKFFENENSILTEKEVFATEGNGKNGKLLFENNCSTCHKVENSGNGIGPDLSKIGQKLDKYGLFEAIIKPNASLVFGYETYSIYTKDGNSYYGFLLAENDKNLTIKDLSGAKINIAKKQIQERIKQSGSIMPSASSLALESVQLNDLITYLTELK